MNKKPISVAIDGPSGAGKSTIARLLANELGFLYVDTGALYRAIGYSVIKRGGDPKSMADVEGMLDTMRVELRHVDGQQRVFVDNGDVTEYIRTPEISMAASAVSAIPSVRAFLLELQRETARRENVIMDGRDIGTVVLPDAGVKIFLTATAEERARRRYDELIERGTAVIFDDVLADIIKRDHDDSTRAAAPLRRADDAIEVNTTGFELEQSVALMRKIVTEAMA